jgi:hypothetical protein
VRSPFHFGLAAALIGLAACSGDQGPLAPAQAGSQPPALSNASATGFFEIGELSYDALLGEEGAFSVQLGINRGLLTAARTGERDFFVNIELSVSNYIEQDIVLLPTTLSLALLKSVDGSAGMEEIALAVLWDALDSEGQPMVGEVVVEYRITLEYRPNPTGDGILVGQALTGTRLVVIA